MNTWLKIKEEASGWPAHVGDDPVKQQEHLRSYKAKEGIELNRNYIEKNPGKRSLAKMMLNSMWGSLASAQTKLKSKSSEIL